VELEGMARALAARDVAAVVLVVLDRSRPLADDDLRLLRETEGRPRVVVANKSDRARTWDGAVLEAAGAIEVSARTGEGVEGLRSALVNVLTSREPARDLPAITNMRHVALVEAARAALDRAARAAGQGTPEEFVLADLHEARRRLEEVTGARTADDVLAEIFSKFCIGK
jgi:tRNA modification GTPase